MILCVFLTFSTVNAADLNDSGFNSVAIDSQSESSFTNLNEDMSNDVVKISEDEDCVESVNELSNLSEDSINDSLESEDELKSDDSTKSYIKSSLSSINSDENSLKSTLSPSGNTFSSIQDAINKAKSGDAISLNGKTYIGNGTIIVINKSITLSGGSGSQKATLDARGLSGILRVNAANVKLVNCNFINTSNKAVIFLNDNGSIRNCDFKDNFADINSHLRVYPNCTNFLLENSNFYNGYCINYTNVAINAKNSTVRNCSFINNTVKTDTDPITGAALQIGQSEVGNNLGSVINCVFINNTASSNTLTAHAGALCFRPGIKVFNTSFINNHCSGMGGATTLHADGELFNCIFINNSAGAFGGAISTGLGAIDISVNISSCIFENNTAPMGGAIQVKGNNVKIVNSTFNGNNASETDGGALFIMGNEALIINSTFNRNFAENIGAGVLINGSYVSILNSSFNGNIADFGAAVYVVGTNASIFSSNFTNHNLISGSVFIKGPNTYVYDSDFKSNRGENGAAIYINGSNSNLILNNFTCNDVSKKGGAVFIEGSNANLIASNFLNNSAILNKSDIGSGLGGAVYIKGDNNTIDSSNFTFNTARNGSAIYTDGYKMTLSNTDFDKNQAWSYVLDSMVNPASSHFNESDVSINFTLIGGNNIANAIYNTASTEDIYFYNVSYVSSKGSKVTGENEIHPVKGAQNSDNGRLLYQDDREDNQLVNVLIYKESNASRENALSASSDNNAGSQDIVLNKTFTTGILGDIAFNMSDFMDEPLATGNYILSAKHFEDDYYKEIDGSNGFEIIPLVDLAINISSSRVNIDFNKTVKYTIKVGNYGPNNATGVKVNAILPNGLIYLSSVPSAGTYDEKTGIWDIGDFNVGDNQTLVINVLTNKTGVIDFPVNVSSNENDSNMKNNLNNKSIRVLEADLSIDVKASGEEFNYGDTVDWTITVKNNGPNNASKIVVSILPFEDDLIYLNSSNSTYDDINCIWSIPALSVDRELSLVISTKANSSNKKIGLPVIVSSDTFDPILSNNNDSDSVMILPLCDLIIEVNMSEDAVNYGDVVDLVVVVSNDGPDGANGVTVSLSDLDSLGLVVLNSSDDSFDKENNEWLIGDLDQGKTVSLTVPLKVNCSNKTIPVKGTVDSDTFEINKKNNHDKDNLTVNPLCDLIIEVNMSEDALNFGEEVDLDVVVSNDGPDDASDVSVSLSDLDSLGLVVLGSSDDSFIEENNEWLIGDLSSGKSISLTIQLKANASNKTVPVNGIVDSSTFELNKKNNNDSDSLRILPLCDLVIKVDMPDEPADYGDVIDLVVTVSNDGPDSANDVCVSLSDLDSLGLVVLNSSDDSFDKDNGEWIVGDLGSGESVSLIVPVKVDCSNETLAVEGEIDSSTFELNKDNNHDDDNLDVNPLCDLVIDISISNSTVYNGDVVDLVVTVSNDGPDDASDVSVSLSDLDSLGLVVLNSSDDSFDNDSHEWVIGDLDSGESVSLTITAKANRSGENITVVSEVETSTFEANKENNLDNDSLSILPVCDVLISISPDNEAVYVGDVVNWLINVTNKGPDKASDVNVFNSLPEGLEFILSESSKGELENLADEDCNVDFIWKVGDLDNDESAYLVISTNALNEGLIPNNASANSSTFDSNESNNFDSSDLQVIVEGNDDVSGDGSNDSSENHSRDDSHDGYEGFPLFDYDFSDKNDSGLSKSNGPDNNDSKNPIDLSNKKTGNPFIGLILSIFALFMFPFRKN